tara:strand:- start:71394 stop:72272 length:879 start_codon:yes stop_codon:yes gene_type:complete
MVPQHAQLPVPTFLPVLYAGDPDYEKTLDDRIAETSAKMESLRAKRKSIENEMERVSMLYRAQFPNVAQGIIAADEEIAEAQTELMLLLGNPEGDESAPEGEEDEQPEDVSHDEKKARKARKRNSKDIYGKICNLCHPDKNKGLEQDRLDELTELFIEATDAYKARNLERLIEIYATVMALRSGKSDHEIAEEKRKRLEYLLDTVEGQQRQIDQLREHVVYHVMELHNSGNRGRAKSIYGQVFRHMLQERHSMLNGIRSEIAKIKRMRNGDPEPPPGPDGYEFTVSFNYGDT